MEDWVLEGSSEWVIAVPSILQRQWWLLLQGNSHLLYLISQMALAEIPTLCVTLEDSEAVQFKRAQRSYLDLSSETIHHRCCLIDDSSRSIYRNGVAQVWTSLTTCIGGNLKYKKWFRKWLRNREHIQVNYHPSIEQLLYPVHSHHSLIYHLGMVNSTLLHATRQLRQAHEIL